MFSLVPAELSLLSNDSKQMVRPTLGWMLSHPFGFICAAGAEAGHGWKQDTYTGVVTIEQCGFDTLTPRFTLYQPVAGARTKCTTCPTGLAVETPTATACTSKMGV